MCAASLPHCTHIARPSLAPLCKRTEGARSRQASEWGSQVTVDRALRTSASEGIQPRSKQSPTPGVDSVSMDGRTDAAAMTQAGPLFVCSFAHLPSSSSPPTVS